MHSTTVLFHFDALEFKSPRARASFKTTVSWRTGETVWWFEVDVLLPCRRPPVSSPKVGKETLDNGGPIRRFGRLSSVEDRSYGIMQEKNEGENSGHSSRKRLQMPKTHEAPTSAPVGRGGDASSEVASTGGVDGVGGGGSGDGDPGAVRAAQASALLLLALSGSAVNGLAVLVFIRRPTLRSPSNRFVLSLVLANLLAAATAVPVVALHLAKKEVSRLIWWRQLVASLGTLSATASVFSILAIAVDRYRAVTSPLHYSMTATRQRSRLIIASTWLLAIILATPPLLATIITSTSPDPQSPSPHPTVPSSSSPAKCVDEEDLPAFPIAVILPLEARIFRLFYAIILASLGFVIPLLALCWIYVHMYLAARRNSQRTRRHSLSAPAHQEGSLTAPSSAAMPDGWVARRKPPPRRRCSNASLPALLFREEGRAVKTAALVIVSFLFCWAPFFCALIMDSRPSAKRLPDAIRFCALLAALSSGPVTPFLYVFRNEAARTEALKILFWWRAREDPGTPRWGDSIQSPLTRPRAPPLGCYSHRRGKVPPCCPPRGAVSLDSGGELDRNLPKLSPRSRSWSERQDSVSIHSFGKCGQCGNGDQVPMLDLVENPAGESLTTLESERPPGEGTCEDGSSSTRMEIAQSSGHTNPTNDGKPPRRESSFRLAFFPRSASRRCQTCIRQNSDSSSGSGHPLLKDGPTVGDVMGSPRRPHTPTADGEDPKDVDILTIEAPAQTVGIGRSQGNVNPHNDIILELEEQFTRRTGVTPISRAERFSTSSNLTQETSLASSGMGSTVDGSVDIDESRKSVSMDSPWSMRRQDTSARSEDSTPTPQRGHYCSDSSQGGVDSGSEVDLYAPRRARRKLQRLAAVDDLGDATLPEEYGEVFEDLPEDNEGEEAEECGKEERDIREKQEGTVASISPSTATARLTTTGPGPTLILRSFAITPPAKTRLSTGIKARFFRPAFRVPRYDF
ncbi:uncharacterized protein LOC124159752 [Ischnura elegans]|uniref:uncharacterized protein LOC124159752 n=1 Tax=Ischnura elegans TaxID=197161 RepID=UPI001ED8848D|nr:uncharacterized protein LOC124159752 [Ischnura elegans]